MAHREKIVLIDKSMSGEFRFASPGNKSSVTGYYRFAVTRGVTKIEIMEGWRFRQRFSARSQYSESQVVFASLQCVVYLVVCGQ